MSPTKQPETLIALFADRVAADGDQPAIHVRREGVFVARSWNELAADARRAAAVLVGLGVRPGDRVIQVSRNRYEWIVLDLAIQMARAVHVPVHAALAGPQIAYQILDSGAKVAVVSGPDQAEKLAACADRLPDDLRVVSLDPCPQTIGARPIDRLNELADETSEQDGRRIEQDALREARPGDLVTILYTSGTTGEPKGVMLSQRNLVSNVLATIEVMAPRADDVKLNWLPLSHIFARTCDLYLWIAGGGQMALSASPDVVIEDCQAVRPTVVTGVPYFWEKVYRAVTEKGGAQPAEALRAAFGGRLRLGCSGGAALPDHVAEFYLANGITLMQGYGLTESSPVISFCPTDRVKVGTVGPAIPGVEIRIADDGEILTRGPHVMLGYWNRPEATAEAIRDGWLHTGDLGSLDEDGYLSITGRKKELIVTAGGKNIAPVYLEALLTADPLIAQAVVIGDGRKFLSALIVPEPEALKAEIVRRAIPVRSPADALVHPDVLALYEERIAARLADVSRYEQVCKFTLLDRGFSIESGELTPTLKLRRATIETNLSDPIEAMYADEERRAGASGGTAE